MDELTEHAEKHCSHLTKDNYYWRQKMVEILVNQPGGIPLFWASRLCIYEAAGVPRPVYEALDTQALHTALGKVVDNAQTS
jgi:hypothetical protein